MSDEIIKILDDLGRRFGVVIDWSSENIMPYLQDLMQRYINYEVMTSVMWIVVALIVIIGLSISIPVINKHANKVLEENHYSDWDFWQMVSDLDFYYYNRMLRDLYHLSINRYNYMLHDSRKNDF